MLGYRELIIVLLIALLIFGAKKIPEIARSIGKGAREFKRAFDGYDESDTDNEGNGSTVTPDNPRSQQPPADERTPAPTSDESKRKTPGE